MRTPRRVEAPSGTSVTGQAAPANVVAAARIGRRAVIARVATSVNAKTASTTTPCMSGRSVGLNGNETS